MLAHLVSSWLSNLGGRCHSYLHFSEGEITQLTFKTWYCRRSRANALKKLYCLLTFLVASLMLGQKQLEELVQGEALTPFLILKCSEA